MKQSLRICLASWAPFHAGAEVAAERLAIGLRDDGHDVKVVLGTEGETYRRMKALELDVQCVPLVLTDKKHWLRYQRVQRELCQIFKAARPDVVHANDLPTSQMVGRAARRLGIPRVCHHRWIFDGPALDWLNKYGAERHLFVSSALMQQLCRESNRLAASQCAVVHDGLPLPALPTPDDRATARRKLGLPLDQSLVLFAGQIIERKGVGDLLLAWATLQHDSRQAADLVIIGDDLENQGAYRRQMELLASELRVPVRFMGFQRNVPEWLTAADLCIVPSHAEPLGNATLEAMAYGLPVVGSAVGGIPEMIVDGETGLLVSPKKPPELAAAIGKVLDDPQLCQRLGRAARARCEQRFSLRAHVSAVVEQYRAALIHASAPVHHSGAIA